MDFTLLGIKQLQRDLDARLNKLDKNLYCVIENFTADLSSDEDKVQSYTIRFRAGVQVSSTEYQQSIYTLYFDNVLVVNYSELLTMLFIKALEITGYYEVFEKEN